MFVTDSLKKWLEVSGFDKKPNDTQVLKAYSAKAKGGVYVTVGDLKELIEAADSKDDAPVVIPQSRNPKSRASGRFKK